MAESFRNIYRGVGTRNCYGQGQFRNMRIDFGISFASGEKPGEESRDFPTSLCKRKMKYFELPSSFASYTCIIFLIHT